MAGVDKSEVAVSVCLIEDFRSGGFDRRAQKYYHARLMSAPPVIDGFEFARSGQEMRGRVDVGSLNRLEDILFDSQGTLDYVLKGTRDERNRPQLELSVTGGLHLQCQRCLGLLDYSVAVANRLLLVEPGAPLDGGIDDSEGPDMIEASGELDVRVLVEDEVLLSLPLAPRHPEGICESRFGPSRAAPAPQAAFAKLAVLKGSQKQN